MTPEHCGGWINGPDNTPWKACLTRATRRCPRCKYALCGNHSRRSAPKTGNPRGLHRCGNCGFRGDAKSFAEILGAGS